MDFRLTDEEKMIRDLARDFTEREVKPIAAQIDEEAHIPDRLWDQLRELGIFGLPFPVEYGGVGGTFLSYILATEELARGSAVVSMMSATGMIFGIGVSKFGNEEQKRRFLAPVASGERKACICFTEPATGTDPSQIETRAVLDGDEYVINGRKQFISMSGLADFALIYCKMSNGKLGALIAETKQPGFKPGKREHFLGVRGLDDGEVILENLRVPRSNLVGREEDGFGVLLSSEPEAKCRIAAACVGIGQAALDESVAYAQTRMHRGKPIGEKFQTIQWLLGDMEAKLEAARWLVYRASALHDEGAPATKLTTCAKLFASETARDVVNNAMQVHGVYGYTKEFSIERLYRDAKVNELFHGVNEIQRVIIAHTLLSGETV
ncbi:MAG: acyl-CoA dehydrogenase family protein [Chloroflexi bacterium]|nr:acyl-CoA dehydrogenase family protein [Chloroflexota bacterium]